MQNGFGYAWINQGVGNVKTFLAKLKERLIDCKWQQVNAHINEYETYFLLGGHSPSRIDTIIMMKK